MRRSRGPRTSGEKTASKITYFLADTHRLKGARIDRAYVRARAGLVETTAKRSLFAVSRIAPKISTGEKNTRGSSGNAEVGQIKASSLNAGHTLRADAAENRGKLTRDFTKILNAKIFFCAQNRGENLSATKTRKAFRRAFRASGAARIAKAGGSRGTIAYLRAVSAETAIVLFVRFGGSI